MDLSDKNNPGSEIPQSTDEKAPSKINPWLLIVFLSPIPMIILFVLIYKWTTTTQNFKKVTTQMIQRQNSVLIHDAMEVAREVTQLLEVAAKDVQTLALIPPTVPHYTKFYLSRVSDLVQLNPKDESVGTAPYPLYSSLVFLSHQGDEVLHLNNGKVERYLKRFSQCIPSELCDKETLQKIIHSSVGEVLFGNLMRWYSSEGTPEIEEEAHLPVAYHGTDGIYILGIDYRFIKEFLTRSTFPYERKRNLLQSYANGNYIYLVGGNTDFIAHPKYWHVTGISKKTLERITSMTTDADEGTHSLNVRAYRGERLKSYFDRLLKRSFLQRTVDVFQASNLKGTNRVLSVAPILLNRGQYRNTGVFGYVVLGCSVDYFEEPKEQYVPYY